MNFFRCLLYNLLAMRNRKKEMLETLASSLGLSKMGEDSFYGVYKGYEVNLLLGPSFRHPLQLLISTHINDQEGRILYNKLRLNRRDGRAVRLSETGAILMIPSSNATLSAPNEIASYLDSLVSEFTLLGLKGSDYCPFSEIRLDESNSKIYEVAGAHLRLSKESAERINEQIDSAVSSFEARPNNYFQGFGGALLAILAATVLEVLLLNLNFMAGFSILIALYGGLILYRRFKGKEGPVMVWLIGSASFLMVGGGILGFYYHYAISYYEGGNNLERLSKAFADNAYFSSFLLDIIFFVITFGIAIAVIAMMTYRRLRIPDKLK